MGYGDELMATARARSVHERNPTALVAIGQRGAARSHPVFENNPRLAPPGTRPGTPGVVWLEDGPGARPYIDYRDIHGHRIDYKASPAIPWRFTGFAISAYGPGEIWFTPAESSAARALAEPLGRFVVLEPTLKPKASPNKRWPADRWAALAARLAANGVRPVQLGPRGTAAIPGAEPVETPTFRVAAAVLAQAAGAIVPEGGLHHAAAAVRTPAVVLYGGYASPAMTGYAGQAALYRPQGSPCGMRVDCEHCRRAMDSIGVDDVLAAARGLFL